jgi:predicted transcriptional regulator
MRAMRSLRLDPELDRQVRKAAAMRGESVSEFIRQAAAKRVEATLAERGRERFADVAGAVHGGGGRARRTGEAFADALANAGRR